MRKPDFFRYVRPAPRSGELLSLEACLVGGLLAPVILFSFVLGTYFAEWGLILYAALVAGLVLIFRGARVDITLLRIDLRRSDILMQAFLLCCLTLNEAAALQFQL
ncbi:MAG: hypothetical protein LAT62_15060, partial [Natronospirillum sp.]|uniref:hypothetical protein n=1 Tax=Natronospirillum sp. TaxID=2812955 RepID=UPI0025EF5A40